jgi:hypothetical protein
VTGTTIFIFERFVFVAPVELGHFLVATLAFALTAKALTTLDLRSGLHGKDEDESGGHEDRQNSESK